MTIIEDLRALKARYFRLLDDKQWDAFGLLFTEDAVMDLSDVLPASTPTNATLLVGRDAIVRHNRGLLAQVVMVHNGYAHENEVQDAETASAIWAQEDRVLFPDGVDCPFPFGEAHNFGRYHERFRKDGRSSG